MNFADKLILLRKNKGYTQEQLAADLNVSRQAIAKWESGEYYPDIMNLISLSEVLNVTIDNLLKESNCVKDAVAENKSYDKHKFTEFLLTAKKNTYAAKAKEVSSCRPSSHDLRFADKDYLYIDSYLGGELFSGQEGVWIKDIPVWTMNYSGRVLDKDFSGDFLKLALMNVSDEMPYRGPCVLSENDYLYKCSVNGDINWFQGYEQIFYKNKSVYECYFHGGKIK